MKKVEPDFWIATILRETGGYATDESFQTFKDILGKEISRQVRHILRTTPGTLIRPLGILEYQIPRCVEKILKQLGREKSHGRKAKKFLKSKKYKELFTSHHQHMLKFYNDIMCKHEVNFNQ